MKDYRDVLIVVLSGLLVCSSIFSLGKIAYLHNDVQGLLALVNKQKELERILFAENSRLVNLISPQQREVLQRKNPEKAKGLREKTRQSFKSIQGNRGFLIKNSKPAN